MTFFPRKGDRSKVTSVQSFVQMSCKWVFVYASRLGEGTSLNVKPSAIALAVSRIWSSPLLFTLFPLVGRKYFGEAQLMTLSVNAPVLGMVTVDEKSGWL